MNLLNPFRNTRFVFGMEVYAMKKYIQLILYCISVVGIGGYLFFDVRTLGLVGFISLFIVSVMGILKAFGKK